MMSHIQLYGCEFFIEDGGQRGKFCFNLPARNLAHAEEMAKKMGAKVYGTDMHEVSAIPASQLMAFIDQIASEPVKWSYNAGEQLEAFLSMGWPEEPTEAL